MLPVRSTLMILIAVTAGLSARFAAACPFCPRVAPTLSERVAGADAAVLVQWVTGREPSKGNKGDVTFEVLHVAKAPEGAIARSDRIVEAPYREGEAGDLFLLLGRHDRTIDWDDPIAVTETAFQYVAQAPSPETSAGKRLRYFLKFLEYPDPLLADDAFAEFAKADYEDVAGLSDEYPRDRLREWLASSETPEERIGLYGLMLGLCGDEADARRLERRILDDPDRFRPGIDGIMAGFLLLRGEEGLDLIDRTKLADRESPESETYAALQALRFFWTYGDGRIERERLQRSLRLLLDRPALFEFAIPDLARWRDWSVQDRLMQFYDADFGSPARNRATRRAIVRYLLHSVQDVPDGREDDPPEHVLRGRRHLERIQQRDPRTYESARRLFAP